MAAGTLRVIVAGADITAAVTSLEHTSAVGTLGDKATFGIPYSDLTRYNIAPIHIGDRVEIYDDDTASAAYRSGIYVRGASNVRRFSGVVTSARYGENTREYVAYDPMWWFGKSKITMQFVGETFREAVRSLCQELGVTLASCPNAAATAEETCCAETPAQIIKKLLTRAEDMTGTRYNARYAGTNAIAIEEVGARVSAAVLREITTPERQEQLDDVRNRIVYVASDADGYVEEAYAEDAASMAQYGVLQDIVIAGDDSENADVIVHNRLYRQRYPKPTASLECAMDWLPKVGERIAVTVPVVQLGGEWVIERIARTYTKGEARMRFELSMYTVTEHYEAKLAAWDAINNAAISGKLDELRREAQNWSPEDIEAYDAVIEEQGYGELITGQINAQSGGPDRYIRRYE